MKLFRAIEETKTSVITSEKLSEKASEKTSEKILIFDEKRERRGVSFCEKHKMILVTTPK